MSKRIRPGLYLHKGHEVEFLDESAEYYPGDPDYGFWSVRAPDDEFWLKQFNTKREALEAVNKYG